MNTDQFTNLLQKSVVAASAGLAEHGYQSHSLKQAILGAIVALLTWYISHRQNAATSVVGPGTSQSPKGKIPLLALAGASLIALGITGCTSSAVNAGHIVSVTERGFGICVAQQTGNNTPEVKLGFFSSTILLEPVVTNQTLVAPNFANTFALDQSINPFSFGVNETAASGNYYTGNPLSSSNPVASTPVVPGVVTVPGAAPAVVTPSPTPAVTIPANVVSAVTNAVQK